MSRVLQAIKLATKAHSEMNQMYDGVPYIVHPAQVAEIARNFGANEDDILAACWCHDVLEDTKVNFGQLSFEIGFDAAYIVRDVTNPKIGTRAEKHATQYPIIAQSEKAIIVKLSDRISHILNGGKNDMYRKEHEFFKKILYHPALDSKILSMWDYLDSILINRI